MGAPPRRSRRHAVSLVRPRPGRGNARRACGRVRTSKEEMWQEQAGAGRVAEAPSPVVSDAARRVPTRRASSRCSPGSPATSTTRSSARRRARRCARSSRSWRCWCARSGPASTPTSRSATRSAPRSSSASTGSRRSSPRPPRATRPCWSCCARTRVSPTRPVSTGRRCYAPAASSRPTSPSPRPRRRRPRPRRSASSRSR